MRCFFPRRLLSRVILCTLAYAVTACSADRGPTQPPQQAIYTTPTGLQTQNPPEIFTGAGDISSCSSTGDDATALLLDNVPGTIYNLGDNTYPNGTDQEFNDCYDPTWGRQKARTHPSPGNHEYNTNGAAGYFNYFGAAAGDPSKGYYSYDLGSWHIIVLNSNISRSVGSAQDTWLLNDLATHSNLCTLAYWHHALYGSDKGTGTGGTVYSSVRPFWDRLYAAGADVVLSGHRHFYERLAPMKEDGTADPQYGIREFIVGSGGIGGATITTNIWPTSEAVNGDTRGVLKLYLYSDSYAWRFLPIAGKTFTDSGSTACHGAPGSGGSSSGISSSLSTVTASSTSITAGGSGATITVTAKDANGNPVSGATVVLSATGSGNTITQPADTTDANGVATGSFSSTVAEPKTISATAGGVALSQTAAITVTPGAVSGAQSTVIASPTSITAGGGAATITVTAKDANGNPISGATVVLAATGSGNTLVQPADTTDTTGVATGSLSSTVAELKTVSATIEGVLASQTASVSVNPPGVTGTISHLLLTSGTNTANGKVYTTASIAPSPNTLVLVAVLGHSSYGAPPSPTITGGGMTSWDEVTTLTADPQGSPLKRLTIYRALSASPGSGPLTITFSTAVSNAEWVVSQFDGVDGSGTNGSGAIVQTGATVGDRVNGLSVPLAPFADPNDVAYGAFGVASRRPAVTAGSGFTTIAEEPSNESPFSDLFTEWATNVSTVQATWSNLNGGALGVELRAGGSGSGTPSVSASQSGLSAAPSPIAAGSGVSTITVTARDASGTPVSGVNVLLSATGSGNTLVQPADTTDANGVATGTLSSTVAEPKAVSATAGGVSITQTVAVTVDPGPVSSAASTLAAAPTSIQADAETSTITVTARDDNGNPISGATVVLAATGSGNTLVQPADTTDATGVATGTLASSVAEDKTVSATIDGTPVNQTAVVTVTPGAGSGVSASLSSVAVAPASVPAGTGTATITVTVRDGTGTPMSGVTVSLTATGTGNTVTQPADTTDANGVATGTLSSTVAEDKTVTATGDGVTLSQQPVVSITAGPADANQSSVTANPTSIAAGTETATITVTARDAYGNPVSGASVGLSTAGTNFTLTQPAAPTDVTGVATGSLSATDVQTLVVAASVGGTGLTQTASVDITAAPSVSTISQTLLTSGSNTTNGKVYSTASITPAPNTLVLVAVLGHSAYGAPPPPTISGGGMTGWDQVATLAFDPVGSPLKRMTIFRALSTSPSSGPITITFSTYVSNAEWTVSQFDGVDTGGTNGSAAIVQAASTLADGVNGLTVPLSPFADVNDVAYGVFGVASRTPAVTAGSGFTTIAEEPSNESPYADLFTEWATNVNDVQATWSNLNGGALGVELRAGTGQ